MSWRQEKHFLKSQIQWVAKLDVRLNPGLLDCASNTIGTERKTSKSFYFYDAMYCFLLASHTNQCESLSLYTLSILLIIYFDLLFYLYHVVCNCLPYSDLYCNWPARLLSSLYITNQYITTHILKLFQECIYEVTQHQTTEYFHMFLNYKNNSTKMNYITRNWAL